MHPDEFVPYLEYKPALRKYQWIGAGRDHDHLLMPLCTYWLERRDEAAEAEARANKNSQKEPVETDNNIYVDDEEMGVFLPVDPSNDYLDRFDSPPPSCNPTDWVVVPSTAEEKREFRSQVMISKLKSFLFFQFASWLKCPNHKFFSRSWKGLLIRYELLHTTCMGMIVL